MIDTSGKSISRTRRVLFYGGNNLDSYSKQYHVVSYRLDSTSLVNEPTVLVPGVLKMKTQTPSVSNCSKINTFVVQWSLHVPYLSLTLETLHSYRVCGFRVTLTANIRYFRRQQ